jgi:hypothetical protein
MLSILKKFDHLEIQSTHALGQSLVTHYLAGLASIYAAPEKDPGQ